MAAARRRALAALLSSPSSSLLLPLHRLRLLSTISAPSTLTPFYTRVFSSSADTEHGASLTKRGDYHLDLITIGGGRSGGRDSRFVANFGAKVAPFSTVSSNHAGGLAGTTDLQACRATESSIIKPNSSPNQIRSSSQRAAKKKSIRSTQDACHGISPKAMDLIEKVLMLPDVKEVVCKELDKWAISEGKFPIAYVKQAIQVFEREENWSRIIQISEWLVQKEEGKTLRTFEVFLKALDMQQRIDEAEAVWKNDILKKSWSIPTRLVAYVLTMFERHHMPIEVIKLFTMMEDSGRNMDKKSIKRVARAYEQEGFLEMKKQMLLKHNLLGNEQESVDGYKASKS